MGREGRGGKGRSPCLPPRFDNPGYGPVRGGKGGRKGRKGKGRGGKGGREEREEKGKGGERHLALPPQKKKSWRRHCVSLKSKIGETFSPVIVRRSRRHVAVSGIATKMIKNSVSNIISRCANKTISQCNIM